MKILTLGFHSALGGLACLAVPAAILAYSQSQAASQLQGVQLTLAPGEDASLASVRVKQECLGFFVEALNPQAEKRGWHVDAAFSQPPLLMLASAGSNASRHSSTLQVRAESMLGHQLLATASCVIDSAGRVARVSTTFIDPARLRLPAAAAAS